MHGEGCRLLSLRPCPHLTPGSLHSRSKLAGLGAISESAPSVPDGVLRAPRGRDTPWKREHWALCVNTPGSRPGRDGGGVGGGRQRREVQLPAGQVPVSPVLAGRAEWSRHPLLQAKLKRRESPCFSVTVQTSGALELTCAAGVALQQPHDGGVALGTFNELFQGQFACGRADRRRESAGAVFFTLRGVGTAPAQGAPLWLVWSLHQARRCLGTTYFWAFLETPLCFHCSLHSLGTRGHTRRDRTLPQVGDLHPFRHHPTLYPRKGDLSRRNTASASNP